MEKLKCSECDYEELKQTYEDKDMIVYNCPRCDEDFVLFKSTNKLERLLSEKDL